jgi:hypothetical protein
MDKVYVLTLIDVSDGVQLTNKVEVYANYDKAKQIFDAEINTYYAYNDFTNYNVVKSDNEFFAIHKEEQHNDYVKIDLIETNIIK